MRMIVDDAHNSLHRMRINVHVSSFEQLGDSRSVARLASVGDVSPDLEIVCLK